MDASWVYLKWFGRKLDNHSTVPGGVANEDGNTCLCNVTAYKLHCTALW